VEYTASNANSAGGGREMNALIAALPLIFTLALAGWCYWHYIVRPHMQQLRRYRTEMRAWMRMIKRMERMSRERT
jgi:peptidoglycan/LPS O-acetylase OafA/YrhL